jgi:hypothetical protein
MYHDVLQSVILRDTTICMNWDDFERRHKDREERRRQRSDRRARHRARRRHRHDEPKERVLHTRISEQLSDDIRSMAEELRVPVSNLVRNVLEEAFSVVETVSENVGDLLEEVLDEAEVVRRRYRVRRGDLDAEPADDDEPLHDDDEASEEQAAAAADAPPERPRPAFPEVLGWQPMLLNREAQCADCSRGLPRGKKAFVGMTGSGLSSTVLCRKCTGARG